MDTQFALQGQAHLRAAQDQMAYTDVKQLNALKDGSDQSIAAAARQFESVFIDLWLKSMRDANAAFGEGSYFDSHATEMHEEMLDKQWAVTLSERGGVGLAEVIERQLRGEAAPIRRSMTAPRVDGAVTSEPATSKAETSSDEQRSFVERVGKQVLDIVGAAPIPPLAVLAQAALETGWGRHVPSDGQRSSNNLFGIKANGWTGPSVTSHTQEFLHGRPVVREDRFRAYANESDSIQDYVNLVTKGARYTDAVSSNDGETVRGTIQEVARYADKLVEAGYATDPSYAEKLVDVARSILRLGMVSEQ